jgi:cytoskeletal protein CcmA (bactofilin family)
MQTMLDLNSANSIPTYIGNDCHLKGTVKFTDSVRIAGSFEGEITASGFVLIESGAVIKAKVHVKDMVVSGEIHGNVVADGMVELLPGAKVFGNIRSGKLRICDGVVFEGKCEMIRNAANVDIFANPLHDLRKSIEMDRDDQWDASSKE